VVKHDTKNDFDSGPVELPGHGLKLDDGSRWVFVAGIASFGREEGDRIIAPIVPQREVPSETRSPALIVAELLDRQEFNGGNAKGAQIGDLLHKAEVLTGMIDARCRILCEAANVGLINDQIALGLARSANALPVESVVDDKVDGIGSGQVRIIIVFTHIQNRRCIRVEKELAKVAARSDPTDP
jgi:hypothetical protein